jgi:uncharacterized protein
MPKISQLWIYPIKSLPGILLKKSRLFSKGLENDRSFMLVDSNNLFLSQRKLPKMALISVSIEEQSLIVSHKEKPDLLIPWPKAPWPKNFSENNLIKVKVWHDECEAIHLSSIIDKWFSDILGIDCKLVYLPDESLRYVDNHFAKNNEQTRFSDGFPLLLIGEESLNDLNSRLQKKLTMRSFRPNIVVNDCDAYAEDSWNNFIINKSEFSAVKACSRCIITTIDPDTAEKSKDREPLKTLQTYRQKDRQVFFGQNILFKVDEVGLLAIGDELLIK